MPFIYDWIYEGDDIIMGSVSIEYENVRIVRKNVRRISILQYCNDRYTNNYLLGPNLYKIKY